MLNLPQFFRACSPAYTLGRSKSEEQRYYVDFSSVFRRFIQDLKQTITQHSPNTPTRQFLTGYIGSGKSTILSLLQTQLEQEGFHVIYFNYSQKLDLGDVDFSEIILAIAHQISQNFEENEIQIQGKNLQIIFQKIASLLKLQPEFRSTNIASITGGITDKINKNRDNRCLLRQYLFQSEQSIKLTKEELTDSKIKPFKSRIQELIEAINEELLVPGIKQLESRGKRGLVVLVDDLEKIDNLPRFSNYTQVEDLWINRGQFLKQFKCHFVYTIPLILTFSQKPDILTQCFEGNLKVLPMVPVKKRDGKPCEKGMNLLRQIVLCRAFPDVEPDKRLSLISEIFDSLETLDRLCQVSGGHIRHLLILLSNCIQKEDPPFYRHLVEQIIMERCNELSKVVTPNEWKLIAQVAQSKMIQENEEYQMLLRCLLVLEYYDDDSGRWFDINPILAESSKVSELLKAQES